MAYFLPVCINYLMFRTAFATDTFSLQWSKLDFYAFPPFSVSLFLFILSGILFPVIKYCFAYITGCVTGLWNLMWLRCDVDSWQVRITWLINETCLQVEVWSIFYLVISPERRSHMPFFSPYLPPSFHFSCNTHFEDWHMRISFDKIESRSIYQIMQMTAFKTILARRINKQGSEDYENTFARMESHWT